jgi:hypothetical protein
MLAEVYQLPVERVEQSEAHEVLAGHPVKEFALWALRRTFFHVQGNPASNREFAHEEIEQVVVPLEAPRPPD